MTPLTALDRSPLPPPSERLFGWPRAHQHHHPGGPPPGDPPQDPAFAAFDPKAYAAYHTSLEGQGPEELMTHYRDRGRKQNRCVGDHLRGSYASFPAASTAGHCITWQSLLETCPWLCIGPVCESRLAQSPHGTALLHGMSSKMLQQCCWRADSARRAPVHAALLPTRVTDAEVSSDCRLASHRQVASSADTPTHVTFAAHRLQQNLARCRAGWLPESGSC